MLWIECVATATISTQCLHIYSGSTHKWNQYAFRVLPFEWASVYTHYRTASNAYARRRNNKIQSKHNTILYSFFGNTHFSFFIFASFDILILVRARYSSFLLFLFHFSPHWSRCFGIGNTEWKCAAYARKWRLACDVVNLWIWLN